jgi:hypothetical protein
VLTIDIDEIVAAILVRMPGNHAPRRRLSEYVRPAEEHVPPFDHASSSNAAVGMGVHLHALGVCISMSLGTHIDELRMYISMRRTLMVVSS